MPFGKQRYKRELHSLRLAADDPLDGSLQLTDLRGCVKAEIGGKRGRYGLVEYPISHH
jgi:hypothetical protein